MTNRKVLAVAAAGWVAGSVAAADLPLGEGTGARVAQNSRPYTVTVGAGYVGFSSCNCNNFGLINSGEADVGPGNNMSGMTENPLMLWNLGVTILPDTWNLALSVSGTLSSDKAERVPTGINRGGDIQQKDEYYSAFLRPSFAVTPVGGFGVGVERLASQKGIPGSASGGDRRPISVVDRPNDGKNPAAVTGLPQMVMAREDSLGFDTDFTRYKLSYHFPVWDFLGVEYAKEKGNRQFSMYGVEQVPGSLSSTAFVSRAKFTGNRIAAGWMPDPAKRGSGFSVSNITIFRNNIKANYYDYQLGRQENLNSIHFEGFTMGFNYRWKMGGYLLDASFFAEKRLESYPDRKAPAGYVCTGCGVGDEIQRTEGYVVGAVSVTF